MANTRSNLTAAFITEVDEFSLKDIRNPATQVDCMFNPYEYTVSKTNTFKEAPKNASDSPMGEFTKAGTQTLKLKLFFDTYEEKKDVSELTNKLWKLMEVRKLKTARQNSKESPPLVAFEWGGVFRFVAYITNMTQKFTLFLDDGTPVRADVDVTFTQYTDLNDYPKQNPTSGGGPAESIRQVVLGDRLDSIAAEVYQDAARWRLIAEHNRITNPFALKAGTRLRIPLQ